MNNISLTFSKNKTNSEDNKDTDGEKNPDDLF